MLENSLSPEKSRILIVDDEDTVCQMMRIALSEAGYSIETVNNGPAALLAIENKTPDMVLLDVFMPGMSGYEVCSEIRKHHDADNVSIIMVTVINDPDSLKKIFELGATAFISKPINWGTFPYQIQYLLKARNALASLKQNEQHLEHMDRITQILNVSKDKNQVLNKALHEMLDIFYADRAFILHSHESGDIITDIISEAKKENCTSVKCYEETILTHMESKLLHRAKNSEFPIVSTYKSEDCSLDIKDTSTIPNQMLKALHVDQDEAWFLVIQQCNEFRAWSDLEQERFLRIGLRLGAVLSSYIIMDKLHQSEKLLRQAQQIGHLGNWRWNVKNDQLTWSEEIYNIYGRKAENFTPTYNNFFKINFEEDNARLRQFEQSILKPGQPYSIEHRIRLPNGEIRWLDEQSLSTHDDNGNLIEVNGTVQDITDRIKKQEQEIHDQKMDAIGQLTSGVAHDYGNLMTIAQCNLELLDEIFIKKSNVDYDARQILDDTRSAIHDGVELTRQLLTFSHKKSIAPEYIGVSESIDSFSKLIKNTLGDKITLSLKIQKNLPDILVDAAQFESALLNIIINARDAMPTGGQLTIQAVTQKTPSTTIGLMLDTHATEQYVCITIRDTGSGMSNDVLKRSIEPFFTTKKNEGTGLGLSMVYGFIRQSGGNMVIDSHPGAGTCIKLWFPVYHDEKLAAIAAPKHNLQPFANETVLVVEDNSAVRRFAVRCLQRHGLIILEAKDAATAQQQLRNNDNINLLFTDILMPGDMSGRDLAAWAAKNHPHLKILLTTAAEKEALEQKEVASQEFPILLKPYNKQSLIESIRNIL